MGGSAKEGDRDAEKEDYTGIILAMKVGPEVVGGAVQRKEVTQGGHPCGSDGVGKGCRTRWGGCRGY